MNWKGALHAKSLFRRLAQGYYISRGLSVFLLALPLGSVWAAVQQLSIDSTSYQLVSEQRVGRTTYQYTYRVNVVNLGTTTAAGVIATVSSNAASTVINDDAVTFGTVPPGATVTSSDTFSFTQDRTVAFDPGALKWTVTAASSGTAVKVVVDRLTLFLPGIGQTVQVHARVLDATGTALSSPVTWSSSAADQISVDANGLVKSQAIGSALIFAHAGAVSSAPVPAFAAQPAAGALLLNDAQILAIGKPLNLDPDRIPGVGTQYEVTVQSSISAPPKGTVVLAAQTKKVAGVVVTTRDSASGLVLTLALAPLPQLFTAYDIRWEIDLTGQATEAAPPDPPLADLRMATTSLLASDEAVTPRDESPIEPFKNVSCDASLAAAVIVKKFSVTPHNGLHFVFDSTADFFTMAVQGSLTLSPEVSLGLGAGVKVDGKCEFAVQIPIPAEGPISVVISPAVRLGFGASLGGTLTLAQGDFELTGDYVLDNISIGVNCQLQNIDCEFLHTLTTENRIKPIGKFGDTLLMHVTLDAEAYGLIGLDASFLAGAGTADLLRLRIGPKQSFDLETEDAQASQATYASSYDLNYQGTIEAGSSLNKLIKIAYPYRSKLLPSLSYSFGKTKLGESPKGNLKLSTAHAAIGKGMDFTVDLDPGTINYLGQYNVTGVNLYRQGTLDPEFTSWKAMDGGASGSSHFTYHWVPTGLDAGDYKIAAFVNTLLPVGPWLEVADDSVQPLSVSCFSTSPTAGPQSAGVPSIGAAADAQTCADEWVGSETYISDGTVSGHSNMTWKVDPTYKGGSQVKYIATGTFTIDFIVYDNLNCTPDQTHFDITNGPNDANWLIVSYGVSPPSYAGDGQTARDITFTCPGETLKVPDFILIWFSGTGNVSTDGTQISYDFSNSVGSTKYTLTRH